MIDTKALRQKILDMAIKGKLVPQDPNDEPASVLLERIRAEKQQLIKEGKIKKDKHDSVIFKGDDNRYYEKVGSEVKDITEDLPFEIPDSWVWTRFSQIVSFDLGKTPDRHNKRYWNNGKYPWFTIADLQEMGSASSSKEKISEIALNEKFAGKLIPRGTLLMSFKLTVGKTSILDVDAVHNEAIISIFPIISEHEITRNFLLNALPVLVLCVKKRDAVKGATLNSSKLATMFIPLPPLSEQHRIVAEIERWFSLINIIENNKEDLQTVIKQAKSKILDLAIHGKLVPQDPNDEPASELLKRINPKAEITCDNGHYPQLPRGWCKCRLENIVEYEQPQAYIVNSTDYDDRYLTPVLTAGKSFIIGYTNETEGIYQNTPCIIFDDFTTDSKLVDFPFKVKSSAMKILKVADNIEIEYVAMFMNITRLIGDTHKRYWISEYSKLNIPIPPTEEQKRIINAVNAMFEKLDAIMENL